MERRKKEWKRGKVVGKETVLSASAVSVLLATVHCTCIVFVMHDTCLSTLGFISMLGLNIIKTWILIIQWLMLIRQCQSFSEYTLGLE